MANKILIVVALLVGAGAYYEYRGVTQELVRTKAALIQEEQKVAELKVELDQARRAALGERLRRCSDDLMAHQDTINAVAMHLQSWRQSFITFAKSLDDYRKELISVAADVAYKVEEDRTLLTKSKFKKRFVEVVEDKSDDISRSLFRELQSLGDDQEYLAAQIGILQREMNWISVNPWVPE
jgi:chromosome segregation ATPase